VTVVIVGIGGWNILLHFVSAASREKCDTNKVWEIENYKIIEKQCIGFAGPYFYPVHLYKNNTEIDQIAYKSDSCIVEFSDKDGKTLRFDLCSNRMVRNE